MKSLFIRENKSWRDYRCNGKTNNLIIIVYLNKYYKCTDANKKKYIN